jgi:hypothetical protein
MMLAPVPVTGTSSAPPGPVPSEGDDEGPEVVLPVIVLRPDLLSREDFAFGLPAPLEDRAAVADGNGLDLLAGWERTRDDSFPRD